MSVELLISLSECADELDQLGFINEADVVIDMMRRLAGKTPQQVAGGLANKPLHLVFQDLDALDPTLETSLEDHRSDDELSSIAPSEMTLTDPMWIRGLDTYKGNYTQPWTNKGDLSAAQSHY